MPIYAYKCDSCGHQKDVLRKMSDPPLSDCPACGAATFSKQVTAAGFQLKGSGWYVTDFKGNGAAPAKNDVNTDGKSDAKADGKSDASGEAKSDAKADSKTDSKSAAPTSAPAPASASASASTQAPAVSAPASTSSSASKSA